MEPDTSTPRTAEEYIELARSFTTLTNAALSGLEQTAAEGDLSSVARSLPKIISLVNSVGYLRGQDGILLPYRPAGLAEFQSELYVAEDASEKRLWALIDAVCADPESRVAYLASMREYYLVHRTPQEYRETAG